MTYFFRFLKYINPLEHLGDKSYSYKFPLTTMLAVTVVLEYYAYQIAHDPLIVSTAAIFLYVGMIIYFSFRSGITGGMTAVFVTILYYLYIIYSRDYTGEQLDSGFRTTFFLFVVYSLMVFVIGSLKEKIDDLIVKEVSAKNRLLAILKQIPAGILIIDSKGKVIQTNDQLRKIIGRKLRKGDDLTKGEYFLRDVKTEKSIKIEKAPIFQALYKEKNIVDKEYFVSVNGKDKNILVSASPILDNHNKKAVAISIIQDITQIKEIERKKDEFVNMASHELKSPMTSLILYFDILKKWIEKGKQDKALTAINNIKKQQDHLQDIIGNLLDVSRIQTGKLAIEKSEFDLNELLKDAVEAFPNIKQNIRYKATIKLLVNADKKRVYQVVLNLISNAIKYSEGKGDIQLSVTNTGNKLTVKVRDHGIGIDMKNKKMIFDKLYQVREDKAGTYPGFGMGLFIAKEIVNLHKGEIWVDSELNKGSTFYFTLPLKS